MTPRSVHNAGPARARRAGAAFLAALLALPACGGDEAPPEAGTAAAPAADPADAPWPEGTVKGLLNPGFEWLADSTTAPPKLGAYWVDAFSPRPGEPDDLIAVDRAPRSGRAHLSLPVGRSVHQKIVALRERPAPAALSLAVRLPEGGALDVILEDGPGRRHVITIDRGFDDPGLIQWSEEDDGWVDVWLRPAERFADEHGGPPVPRLNLHLAARGPDGARVDVDDVQATVPVPRVTSDRELVRRVEALVRWQLETWLLERDAGGLGLVDPATGYVRASAYDAVTGAITAPARTVSFHTIHRLLVLWLRHVRVEGDAAEIARWTPHLRRIVATLLERNVHPQTGLPRNVLLPPAGEARPPRPLDDQPVTVGAYVEFLLDARPLLDDPALEAAVLAACRRMADTLVRLADEHDRTEPNRWDLEQATGILRGRFDNWHGHIPNKLTPEGAIDTPRRFNTAWAIVTGRSFWYHLFQSPAAIMRVHALDPRPGDLPAIRRALRRYAREWDAHRYQLENDTDDHYGYLCEDVLALLHHSPEPLPEALDLVQAATDHRLSRTEGPADGPGPDGTVGGHTLWLQGARLGTPCAGDSPRAILGLVELWSLPPRLNPATSGLPLYRAAVLELAASDYKGRQLTNGQFTESFFKNWEMVCICYRGNLQDDCRTPPPEGWHGDVGDTFGGPPTSALQAQRAALSVVGDDAEARAEILSRLALIHRATEAGLRREHGYLFGLDEKVARQYELPEKYTIGLTPASAAGLGYVLTWARMLPHLEG